MQNCREVLDFEPKKYIRPRKSLKVMSRDIQLGFAAADMAVISSGLTPEDIDPEKKGVIFGADLIYTDVDALHDAYRNCLVDGEFDFSLWGTHALANMHPLWLLKYLPNMAACHIGIFQDARGPNNSITVGDTSSLQALSEAVHVIQRGKIDVVIFGGTSSQLNPTVYDFRGRGDSRVATVTPQLFHDLLTVNAMARFIVKVPRHLFWKVVSTRRAVARPYWHISQAAQVVLSPSSPASLLVARRFAWESRLPWKKQACSLTISIM